MSHLFWRLAILACTLSGLAMRLDAQGTNPQSLDPQSPRESPQLTKDKQLTEAEREKVEFFESHVRPVLIASCLECHSLETEASGGLLLDSAPNWQAGGDSGAAIIAGEPAASLLLKAIAYDDPDLQMPPEGKLSDQAIDAIRQWIQAGAIDPRTDVTAGKPQSTALSVAEAQQHWAYRPLTLKPRPSTSTATSATGSTSTASSSTQGLAAAAIDGFINDRLLASQLDAAAPVGREQLLRRLTFDLNGLPPTPEQLAAFLSDNRLDAVERQVDRLLSSPRFGETLARHWMDVARYAESVTLRGFVLPEAWRYRDYLIDAFNADRPFDQMIVEQVAGDLLVSPDIAERTKQLVATGFLTFGNTNLEEQDKTQLEMDFIDEQLEVMGRAFLGQTIGCARCHDHKFDPIPTRDYYALAGIFRNTTALIHSNVSKWVEQPLPLDHAQTEYFASLDGQLKKLNQQIAALKPRPAKSVAKTGKSVALASLAGIVIDDADAKLTGVWTPSTSVSNFVAEHYLHDGRTGAGDKSAIFETKLPTTGAYRVRMAYTPGENRATNSKVVVFGPDGEQTLHINQRNPPNEDELWISLGEYRFEANGPAFVTVSNEGADGHVVIDAIQFLPQAEAKSVAAVVSQLDNTNNRRATAPADIQSVPTELKELEAEQKRLQVRLAERPNFMTLTEKTPAQDLAIHIRGNVHNLGEVVPRGFLTALDVEGRTGIQFDASSSGRLQLAHWLSDTRNPLTARVYANRIWSWLLGQGLVTTTNNFGTTGMPPSHPELLDWLANELMRSGWSTKHLVRCVVLTDAYRRRIVEPSARAQQQDPNNQLLWRGNLRRISVEAMRDAMLQVSGELDLSVGGSLIRSKTAADYNYQHQGARRSVYQPVFRNSLPELFEAFDFADTSVSIGERSRSTVAPQALVMLNHPWVVERAQAAAQRIVTQFSTAPMAISQVYLQCVGRQPSQAEAAACLSFLAPAAVIDPQGSPAVNPEKLASVIQSLMASLDFRYLD